MKNNLIPYIIIILLWSSMVGCGKHTNVMPDSAEAFSKKVVIAQNTPGAIVKAAVMAGNERNYLEAAHYLSTDCLKFCKGELVEHAGGISGIIDRDTRNGTVTEIIIVKEIVSGDGAEVISVFHYKDGSIREDHTKMIKEDGVWRISCF